MTEHARRLGLDRAGRIERDREIAKVGERQRREQRTAIGMRVRAHPAMPGRRELRDFRTDLAARVEQLGGAIAAHPRIELREMLGLLEIGDRDLVRAPRAFDRQAIDDLGPGPAFRRLEHDHRPARTGGRGGGRGAGVGLDRLDRVEHRIERRRHLLMEQRGIVALDEIRLVAVAAQQIGQLVAADPREDRRIGDLEAVEVEDRQHRAVARGIEELVAVPACRERPGLGLPVADDAGDDQVGIIERRAIGMRERIAELAALVDRTRAFGRDVARDPARPGKLPEQPLHPAAAALDRGIMLGVGAFEIGVGDQPRPAMPRPDDVDHVEIVRDDQPVEMRVDEIEPGRRAPMAEQPRLDVGAAERPLEQGIVAQVDLPDREIIRRAPIGVERCDLVAGEGIGHTRLRAAAGEGRLPVRRRRAEARAIRRPAQRSSRFAGGVAIRANP